jgi:hypothetical protein
MQRTLTLDVDALDKIRKDQVYIDSYNINYPGGIYNSTYERILLALHEMDEVHTSSLSHQDDIPRDSNMYSLGSMALTTKAKPTFYSTMEDSFATVTTENSLTDHVSKFWNVGCFISILEIPQGFIGPDLGSPYTYVRKRLVSSATLFAIVESITGLNNNGMYSNYGTSVPGVGQGPLNSGPYNPTNGGNNNPTSGQNFGGNPSNFNPNQSPNEPKNSGTGNRKENSSFKRFVSNKASQLGRALTSEEARGLLKDFAKMSFANNLSSRRQSDLIDNLRRTGIVDTGSDFKVDAPFARMTKKNNKISFIKDDKTD